ncbi:hypothetical protein EV193_108199 [Herbihabitans rhizosphaerae]|uniref:Uncharacterized protein n=1 Tax=Herbihabitans rhizosphaerae TaxID=1872711 RepID=A0A4Q7KI53_9PSEU|nr:hypothetical protein [Herbihabitans rhizosphaerae]RZS34849.1 hypothetical protein EV193_108199 [Herbihabitans rhizosphaerae]
MTALLIGLRADALDYSKLPGLDEASMTARIEAGFGAVVDAGFDAVNCLIGTSPDEAEAAVRERLAAGGPFELAMIGGGVRMFPEHTLLFERLVNVLVEAAPGIRFCFNSSPETTIDALRRWVTPG